ncbi:hypothetical protein C8R48DRAFT_727016 [Suillus tomentosus]|nr:hypothetical protein C8R48DRAFT_727016 [Suillus tomentosus]
MQRSGQRRFMEMQASFLDAIVQSNGAGFVGTRGYTMSTVVSRRVQSWHDGATRLIRWGWPGADDH